MVQHSSIDHTGLTGVSTVSYASNVNRVDVANYGGAASTVTRGDHVHLGVTSLSHTSNTFSGPVTLVAQGTVGITSPSTGTFAITAGGAGTGSGDNPVTWTAGTSMPGSPVTNQRITRTDIFGGMDFCWDGTQWRSVQIFEAAWQTFEGEPHTVSGNTIARASLWKPTYSVFLLNWMGTTNPQATNDASNYWTMALLDSANATITSYNTSADTQAVVTAHSVAINAVSTTTDVWTKGTKTLSPGALYTYAPRLTYQVIAT